MIKDIRAPHQEALTKVLGHTESLLYRRGNVNGTFDDLICQALLAERDAEIALSPGFRWGASLLPDQQITGDDLYNQTAITYPAAYRSEMTGAYLKEVLEDVADNLFNPDPYYQQGGDMVRAGGLAYTLTVDKPIGQRISDLTLLRTGEKIDPAKKYVVSGWASINENTEGPPIYDVVAKHIERVQTVRLEPSRTVKVVVSDPAGLAKESP
jgi:sulfur-oxidizing protein SoxB